MPSSSSRRKSRPRVKICCIGSVEEARIAIRHGADALGFVSAMPSGPGVISEDTIAEIAATIPPPVATFLLTSSTDPDEIIEQQQRCGANTLQLVDAQDISTYSQLREALTGVALVQVVHVTSGAAVEEAAALASHVDALLLDSGNPNTDVKELGGTGRMHDWSLSEQIRQRVDVPVFLAGGLHAENVGAALEQVQPFGVDLCSGVRTDGQLDDVKLSRFMHAVRRAAASTA
jgi:phosphoribosylanthranilate isomerase